MNRPARLTVLGGGTWGMSLAHVLADAGHAVRVWEFVTSVVETMNRTRHHPHLPELVIPPEMRFSNDIGEFAHDADAFVCAVPVAHIRGTARALLKAGYAGQPVIIGSKGIEPGTHCLTVDMWEQELGPSAGGKMGVISGPSIAKEVILSLPTAVVASAADAALMDRIQELFMRPWFHVFVQPDVVGVELGGALKNVVAVACGISDGLGFGVDAKAALMTRGLGEMVQLGVSLGARAQTFYGLAGVGDMILTSVSQHGRNNRFGALLGKGRTPEQAQAEVGQVVEGAYTVRAAVELADKHKLEMPISRAVHAVLFEGHAPMDVIAALMRGSAKREQP
jgi:glycerol-3-phosphate dehydrogenase (NAD(P)+)